jgi:ABC-type sugar transport system ATPase subunit
MTREPALRAEDIHKSFGAVTALRGANLTVWPGEVLGLVGDNGAGKSTLVKCVSGRLHPDKGAVYVAGEPLRARSPQAARERGVEVVYQNLALVDSLDIASNLFLGRELVVGKGPLRRLGLLRTRDMKSEAERVLSSVGVNLRGATVSDPVESLSGGQRQGIAVGRAVIWGQKVVLMDEPAAALGVEQTRHVLELVRRLRDRGVAVVFISHNMQQVLEVCDQVSVMRAGRTVVTAPVSELTPELLVSHITGASGMQARVANPSELQAPLA